MRSEGPEVCYVAYLQADDVRIVFDDEVSQCLWVVAHKPAKRGDIPGEGSREALCRGGGASESCGERKEG